MDEKKGIDAEIYRKAAELRRIGNRAVRKAQEENRRLGIPIMPAPSLADIKHTLRQHLPELREQYQVDTLGIFGSYVRQEQRPDSDLDVLVTFR